MATIKTYTDIPQSKKLVEFLSPESADMHYVRVYFEGKQSNWFVGLGRPIKSDDIIPCWSLAALLDVLPNSQGRYTKSLYWFYDAWHYEYVDKDGVVLGISANNAVDACYEMILKLHKYKKL